jgi:hypothetical protein
MKFRDFFQKFNSEENCRLYIKQIRGQEGIICKKCRSSDHCWEQDKWQWECKSCRFRTTLRSGTVMEGNKPPFRYWLTGMHFFTATKKYFSAKSVQAELGHKRIDSLYMQNYLNEFCYKFNRRYFGEKILDRLVVASVTNTWYGY